MTLLHQGSGPISIEDVEREIASGSRFLAFAKPVERLFNEEAGVERSRRYIVCGVVAVLLYDLFLINDWFTLRDRFDAMLVARLGVFTPISVAFMLVSYRSRSPGLLDALVASVGTIGVLLPMIEVVASESPHRLIYQFGTLLIMIFVAVIQRIRFRYAAAALGAMLAIQLITTAQSSALDAPTYVANALFFVTAVLLLLLVSYYLELSERRTFLLALRGRLLQETLERMARIDVLTGLYNRRHLAAAAEAIWVEAARAPRRVSAILLDIDHFKMFNDNYGHPEGDLCLSRISGCLAAAVNEGRGLAFRFGGEEMLVLIPDAEPAEVRRTAEAIQAAIRAEAIPHPVLGEGALVTASMGVAGFVAPEASLGRLIEAADEALYAAKRAGRNCIRPYVAPHALQAAAEAA